MKRLNDKMILAMARYYFNRQQQNDWINLNALSKMAPYCGFTMNHSQKEMPKWDKEGDLHKINELANKEGWHFQACAGTMWFSRWGNKTKTLTHSFECNESNYLDGGEFKKTKS